VTPPTYGSPLAFRQALDARIRNEAATSGATIERIRQLLVFDRFLARVGRHLGSRVVVKGGVVMELRLEKARATRDVDLKWSGPNEDVVTELRAAADLDLGDFLTFEIAANREHPTLRAEACGTTGSVFPSRAPSAASFKRAGINKRLTSHCMRVTSSNLIRQAAGDAAARAMVGHAKDSTDMTFRYSEVDRSERLAAQKAAFGSWLGSSSRAGVTGHTN
jgi:hypothetical protein